MRFQLTLAVLSLFALGCASTPLEPPILSFPTPPKHLPSDAPVAPTPPVMKNPLPPDSYSLPSPDDYDWHDIWDGEDFVNSGENTEHFLAGTTGVVFPPGTSDNLRVATMSASLAGGAKIYDLGNIQITILLSLLYWTMFMILAIPYKVFTDRLVLRNSGRVRWINRIPGTDRLDSMRKQG